MTLNSIEYRGDTVIKSYPLSGNFSTFISAKLDNKSYLGRAERYKTELERLDKYSRAGLPVPRLISSNLERLETTMQRIENAKNFWLELADHNVDGQHALIFLSKCAETLRMIHELGEHGDPYIGNFLVGKRIYAIDFEHTDRGGKKGDLSALFTTALIAVPSDKREIESAIEDGYGERPEEYWTPLKKVSKPFGSLLYRFGIR
ncbi:MAG: hypothetical protein HYX24_05010 [Candidatus Aenigmarchaeota archaeon]|nr:hypothetical protein [Candidatus Aenigmarchaeota archaeon]